MKEVAIGIDIGGTNTAFGVVSQDGKIWAEGSIATQTQPEFADFITDVANEIKAAIKKTGENFKIKGVGIGAPNANYHKGTIDFAPNLRWKGVLNLTGEFRKHFDAPAYATNDANAAAIGEMVYGAAKGMKDFVVITLGTGLGSGLVANGQLILGHDGFAGELGHVTVESGGRLCGCGKHGCLEAYVSATGLRRSVYQFLATMNDATPLRDIPFNQLTAKQVSEQALKGDAVALAVFEYSGRILGESLANTVAHTSPEAFFLFGGLALAGDLIMKPTKEHFEKNLMPVFRNKIKILPSGLSEHAAVVGAGALVWQQIS